MIYCHEVIWLGGHVEPTHICEAEYGTEHTHAALMEYMRELRPEDKLTPVDLYGNSFLVEAR